MKGSIHSIETMGLSDGPGIRFVTFFQGCKLRCKYCHNPDTWKLSDGEKITAEQLVEKAIRYRSYFKSSGGGITCSGGEPLLQPEFLIEYLRLCKAEGLHTTIDTSGCGVWRYEEILQYTDLVLLDVKHTNEKGFNDITGGDMEEFWNFVKILNESNTNVWVRHVVIPGVTDRKNHILNLKDIIKGIKNVQKIQLLPYHNMGVHKYEAMGISYPYEYLDPMCPEKVAKMESFLQDLFEDKSKRDIPA